jgi:hypothetical protein
MSGAIVVVLVLAVVAGIGLYLFVAALIKGSAE